MKLTHVDITLTLSVPVETITRNTDKSFLLFESERFVEALRNNAPAVLDQIRGHVTDAELEGFTHNAE